MNNSLGYEFSFEIKQELINYDPLELEKWKRGDPAVVPPEIFLWKGPGRENGYGYGEHATKRYLINQGFQVLVNNFNLFPVKKSKFAKNNELIKEVIGYYSMHAFLSGPVHVGQSADKAALGRKLSGPALPAHWPAHGSLHVFLWGPQSER